MSYLQSFKSCVCAFLIVLGMSNDIWSLNFRYSDGDVRPILKHSAVVNPSTDNPIIKLCCEWSQRLYEYSLAVRPESECTEKISSTTNIAQIVFHFFTGETHKSVHINSFTERKKKKTLESTFFISGSQTVKMGKRPPQISDDGFSSRVEIPSEKSRFFVIQRAQHNPALMLHRYQLLSGILDILTGTDKRNAYALQKLSKERLSLLEALTTNTALKIIQEIDTIIQSITVKNGELDYLSDPISLLNKQLLQEAKQSLKIKDFNFIRFQTGKLESLHYAAKPLLASIQKKLYGSLSADDLYNSRFYNFSCSEQLINDELFSSQIQRQLLWYTLLDELKISSEQSELLKNTNTAIIQIDTTKAPCKICILDILANAVNPGGNIFKFFDYFSPETQKIIVISYSEPYSDTEGGYPFAIMDYDVYNQSFLNGEFPIKLLIVPNIQHFLIREQRLQKELQIMQKQMQDMGANISGKLPTFGDHSTVYVVDDGIISTKVEQSKAIILSSIKDSPTIQEVPIAGDGNCGYTAMDTTREFAAQRLISALDSSPNEIIPLISEEIEDHFLELPVKIAEEQDYKQIVIRLEQFDENYRKAVDTARTALLKYKHTVEKFTPNQLMELLNEESVVMGNMELLSAKQALIEAKNALEQTMQAKTAFCNRKDIVLAYIQHFISPSWNNFSQENPRLELNYLNFSPYPGRSSAADAIAYVLQRNLLVVSPNGTILHQHIHNPTWETLYLIQTSAVHYNKGVLQKKA